MLRDQLTLSGPVVWPNRPTGAVYRLFVCVRLIYQYSWYMCLFVNDNTCGSCMIGHHLMFSALWDSAWTRLPVNQSIGREGPVNWPAWFPDLNPPDFWLWKHLKTLKYSAPINNLWVLQQRVDNAYQDIWVKPGIFDKGRTSETSWKMRWNAQEPHI
jgi:hypothetical protein